jgi:isopentenyldiphosphate isomerase
VLNDKNELLIQRRAFDKENHPGLWDVSCAGHITTGDSSRNAAVRELKEELGLFAQPQDLEWMFAIESHYVLNNGTYIDNEWVDSYLLKRNVDTKDLILQADEVDSVRMIPVNTFRKHVSSKDSSFVPFWKAYHNLLDYLDKITI